MTGTSPTAGLAGADLSAWTGCPEPGKTALSGRLVRLDPLDWARHGDGLFAALGGTNNADIWTYMPIGPFDTADAFGDSFLAESTANGWRTMVIARQYDNIIVGMASYMRIRAAHGSAEVGCIAYAHDFQRTTGATEAMALMARHVFDDLGYRRYEWKCNNANQASRRAAERFGFVYEGTFRNDLVVKGRNRDTAWYSIIDSEWPAVSAAYERWLSEMNFHADGTQIARLEECYIEEKTACQDD